MRGEDREDLLPCPFCGERVKLWARDDDHSTMHWIECCCGANGPMVLRNEAMSAAERAVVAWNRCSWHRREHADLREKEGA